MEDHWEVGVVVAFRDVQWLRKPKNRDFPEINLGISGNTEGAVGDSIAGLGGRFFIFEFKSDQSKCDDEWDGKGWAKGAHKKLLSLCKSIEDAPKNDDLQTLLKLSLKCHHFLYWGHPEPGLNGILDQLFFEPYLLYSLDATISDGARPKTEGIVSPSGNFKVEILKKFQCAVEVDGVLHSQCPIALRDLGNRKATLIRRGADNIEVPFGLRLEEFQKYLNFLCSNGGDKGESLKVLIANDRGFFRVVTKTSQLSLIMQQIAEGTLSSTPGRPASQRRFSRKS